MAEKLSINKPKELIEATPEEIEKIENRIPAAEKEELPIQILSRRESRAAMEEERQKEALAAWVPKTELGRLVKSGKIKNIDEIILRHKKIVESEIVDSLLKLESDLLSIGQSKGKFGGGKRRAWRQTQKKTMEGNVTSFSCMAVVGDKKGHVGVGMGKAKETLPSRAKAIPASDGRFF